MNSVRASTLRPGLLVGLKTSIRGNVSYRSQDLENQVTDTGAIKSKWETEKTVRDPVEDEQSRKVRGKIRSLISSVCANSDFGLLCPQSDTAELDKKISEAKALADQFNATAKCTWIGVYVMIGRVAADDVEAVRAINSEVSELMRRMDEGVRNIDAAAIREACNKLRSVTSMLEPEFAARAQTAIEAARQAARKIVKAGEVASAEIDSVALRRIAEARTAFIDMDDAGEVAAPEVQGRAIDFDDTPDEPVTDLPYNAANSEGMTAEQLDEIEEDARREREEETLNASGGWTPRQLDLI